MARKKAYYNNSELLSMIKGGSIQEVCTILEKQIKRGQNKSLFSGFGIYGWKSYKDIDTMILLTASPIVDWSEVSRTGISNQSIQILKDYLDMDTVCSRNEHILEDLDFIENNLDIINMSAICKNHKIDRVFIERFKDIIDWNALAYNDVVELDTIINHFDKMNLNEWIRRVSRTKSIMDNKLQVVKLINTGIIELSNLLKNTYYCKDEFLNYLVEEHNMTFDKSEQAIIISKEYSEFIGKHPELFDKELIFKSYDDRGYELWKKLSTSNFEKFYVEEEYPMIAGKILDRFTSLSADFLRKNFKGKISTVNLAEKLCYQYNLPLDLVQEIHNLVENSTRPSSRYRSIIRSCNGYLLTSYEFNVNVINLLNFSRKDFELLLKRFRNESYRCKMKLTEYESMIMLYCNKNNMSNEDIMTLKYNFYNNMYYNSYIDTDNVKEKASEISVMKKFVEEYIKYMNEIPSKFIDSCDLKKIFNKDYIMDLVRNSCKISNAGSIAYNYKYELSLEDIKVLLSLPLNTREKTWLMESICEYQILDNILALSDVLNLYGRKFTIYQARKIINVSNLNYHEAKFVIDNTDEPEENDWHYSVLLSDLYENLNLSYEQIKEFANNEEDLSNLKNVFGKLINVKEISEEELDNIIKERNIQFEGYSIIDREYLYKKYKDGEYVIAEYNPKRNNKFKLNERPISTTGWSRQYKCKIEKEDIIGIQLYKDGEELKGRLISKKVKVLDTEGILK